MLTKARSELEGAFGIDEQASDPHKGGSRRPMRAGARTRRVTAMVIAITSGSSDTVQAYFAS